MSKVLNKKKIRNTSLDLLRIFAVFCVISVHFFFNGGYYDAKITGINLYIQTVMRTLFMICVPLFMILSGYLMNKKEPNKKYYFGIIKTINTYLLATLFTFTFEKFFLHVNLNLKDLISGIFSFRISHYSWYIEMYIGLFLLIPFLNIIFNNLKNKKEHNNLIITLIILTSLPLVTNCFPLTHFDWITNAANYPYGSKLLPTWWISFYPITYYFIGCYLNKYKLDKIKIKNKVFNLTCKNLLIILFVHLIIIGTFNYWRSYNSKFIWGSWQEYNSLFTMITTVIIFILFTKIDTSKWNDKTKNNLSKLSNLTLGIYLISCIPDSIIYPILIKNVPNYSDRIFYFIPCVLFVFIISTVLSYLINIINTHVVNSLQKLMLKDSAKN